MNVVQPGPTNTDINPADGPMAEHLTAAMATGRYGTAEEVAGLVHYLAGASAGGVTGSMHSIDGGISA